MTALSLHLPNKLAQASTEAARNLGISRTEFIRQAIEHELENLQKQQELEAMAKSFASMKKHPHYLKEMEEIDERLNTKLPKTKKQWWTEKDK